MINILKRCNILQEELRKNKEVCDVYTDLNGCYDCLQQSFRNSNSDTYDCLIKLALYTINYGPIYVSEIYHFLEQSKLLENYFIGFNRPVNIMSLGSGFAPDDMALHRYRYDNLLPINFNYYGYDIEPYWNYITNTNASPITYDVLNGFDCTSIDILFINKLFSTLKNHNLNDCFLDELEVALRSLPNDSFVIFNDINHKDMGRDEFHRFALSNSLNCIEKYYFKVADNTYNNGYTEISSSHNICQIPNNLPCPPKPSVNQTVFFLYQKVI